MGIVTVEDMAGLIPLTSAEKQRLGFKSEQVVFKDQSGKVIEFQVARVTSSVPAKQLYDDIDTENLTHVEKEKIAEILKGPILQKMTDAQLEELAKLCMVIQNMRCSSRNIICAKQLKPGDRVIFSKPNDKHIGGKIGVVKEIKKNSKVVVNYDNRGYVIPASMLLLVDPNDPNYKEQSRKEE